MFYAWSDVNSQQIHTDFANIVLKWNEYEVSGKMSYHYIHRGFFLIWQHHGTIVPKCPVQFKSDLKILNPTFVASTLNDIS